MIVSLGVNEDEHGASNRGKVKGGIVMCWRQVREAVTLTRATSFIPAHMKQHRSPKIIVAVAAIGVAGVAAHLNLRDADELTLRPDDEAHVALGQGLYASRCASCHGQKLEGQPNWRERHSDGLLPAPPHDATGHSWHHPDKVLFQLTKFGVQPFAGPDYRSAMPAFQKSAEIRQRQDAINRASRQQQ